VPGARSLWREAAWPARALFLVLAGLFVARAGYRAGSTCDLGGFLRIGAQLLDGRLYEDTFINSYPPFFAVVMAPLAALERVTGFWPIRHAWGAAQLAALVYVTAAFARLLALRLSLGAVALAWLCCWRAIVGDLNNLNVSLFLWALTAAALGAAARGRAGRAGALLGAGTALKIMPGLAALALVGPGGSRRWRLVLAAAGTLAAGVALTFLAMGRGLAVDTWRFWLTRIVPGFGGDWLGNQSWKGLFLRLWPPGAGESAAGYPGRLVATAIGLAVLALVVGRVWWRPAASVRVRTLDAMLVVTAGLPALPITWFHYFTAALPIALAVICGWRELPARPRRLAGALLGLGTVLLSGLDVDVVGRRAWELAAWYGNVLWGALALLAAGLVVREAWRSVDERSRAAAEGDQLGSKRGASGCLR
jgi:hypothetical protein